MERGGGRWVVFGDSCGSWYLVLLHVLLLVEGQPPLTPPLTCDVYVYVYVYLSRSIIIYIHVYLSIYLCIYIYIHVKNY